MQINELFVKPISRQINGVIKADQSDEASVWQELDEYVITKELDTHFRKFIDAYLNAIKNPNDASITGKVGVWVSGFFGSGKSHFIKILSYILENREVTFNGTTRRAIEFFDGKVQDTLLAADIKLASQSSCEVILFNIDSKADSTDEHAILRVFLKVLNEKLGYSGDHPHIAHMERYLDNDGKLQAFKDRFQTEAGIRWEDERDAYHFRQDEIVTALSAALNQSQESAKKWFENAENEFVLSVENLAKWVMKYLEGQSADHRLIFLVDEVGQFIGQNTRLMLNLQTIVENLGTACNGRAWVIVTSQEDIDAVVGEVRASKANDFSKIQGRFRTRLSLSSANVDEVIQKRLLSKTDAAQSQLMTLYIDKADILKNQLSFTNTGMSFKAYADGPDFINVYPFAPYQFQLVQKIFEAIRKHGVTGLHLARGERSMLDAFQSAAQHIGAQKIGVLVPLHRFYPSIESFLEGIVKTTIDKAATNDKLEAFDVLVLKTLFLIRYVDEIKGNVDNLVTLFIDRIDADRLALKNDIEASLLRLEGQTLINRNGDNFFFLTNEERDISREIKTVDLSGPEEAKFLGELIFDEVLKGVRKHRFPDNLKDFDLNRSCDAHPHGNRHEGGLAVQIMTPLSDDYLSATEAQCILSSSAESGQVLVRLDDDSSLGRELRTYLQTDKYVARKNDGTVSDTTKKILHERQSENRERRQRLVTSLEQLLNNGQYFAAGQVVTPKSSNAKTALDETIAFLVRNTFTKLGYLQRLSANPQAEIKAVLSATDVDDLGFDLEAGQSNEQALAEVLNHITLLSEANRQIILHDLVEDRFGRLPFGWPDWEVILLIARLIMKGEISLIMDGTTLAVERIFEAIKTPNKWRGITIEKRKSVDSHKLKIARQNAKDIFGKIFPKGEDALAAAIRSALTQWQQNLTEYSAFAQTGQYPGKAEISDAQGVIKKMQAEVTSFELIEAFVERKNDLLDLSEDIHDLDDFYTKQRPTWEKLCNAQSQFAPNSKWLTRDERAAKALQKMQEILDNPRPYQLINTIAGLIDTVSKVNDEQVAKARGFTLTSIKRAVSTVTAELDTANASSDLRNNCLHPLEQLRTHTEIQSSVAHIHLQKDEAQELADEAVSKIEAAIEAAQKAQSKAKPKAPDTNNGSTSAGDPSTPTPKPAVAPVKPQKKRKIIEARQLTTKVYLETQADIDEYLSKLREELENAIKANARVEIR